MDNTTDIIEAISTGNQTKIIAIFVLGVGSLISGLAPRCISERNRTRFPFIMSLMLCFGAGIIFATAFIHVLPHVRDQMMYSNAEIIMCIGFFVMYFVEEFIHYFFGNKIPSFHDHEPIIIDNNMEQCNINVVRNYGSNDERNYLLNNEQRVYQQTDHNDEQHNDQQLLPNIHCDLKNRNPRICHVSHTEPCLETVTGTLGLLVGLSLHSFIEGLAIGVQDTMSAVRVLLVAVASHKYVMGFCLGLEICSSSMSSLKSHIISIIVFSMGSVIGIGTGMFLNELPMVWTEQAMPILQALAGGTLLYVTVCEVMPREKSRWHLDRTRKYAGIAQFCAVAIGFIIMATFS